MAKAEDYISVQGPDMSGHGHMSAGNLPQVAVAKTLRPVSEIDRDHVVCFQSSIEDCSADSLPICSSDGFSVAISRCLILLRGMAASTSLEARPRGPGKCDH